VLRLPRPNYLVLDKYGVLMLTEELGQEVEGFIKPALQAYAVGCNFLLSCFWFYPVLRMYSLIVVHIAYPIRM
jgi:hypothetical protein